MDDPIGTVPWAAPDRWRAANAALAHSLRRRLATPRRLAQALQAELTALFPLMDRLCARTCRDCADVCCRRAWVWADFRDLLFVHLAGIAPPPAQLLAGRGERCRYAAAGGCRLDRLQRPFVCTWYLCPAQRRVLNEMPSAATRLQATLVRIKTLRRQMEDAYIHALFD